MWPVTNFLSCQNTPHKYIVICTEETYFDNTADILSIIIII